MRVEMLNPRSLMSCHLFQAIRTVPPGSWPRHGVYRKLDGRAVRFGGALSGTHITTTVVPERPGTEPKRANIGVSFGLYV